MRSKKIYINNKINNRNTKIIIKKISNLAPSTLHDDKAIFNQVDSMRGYPGTTHLISTDIGATGKDIFLLSIVRLVAKTIDEHIATSADQVDTPSIVLFRTS